MIVSRVSVGARSADAAGDPDNGGRRNKRFQLRNVRALFYEGRQGSESSTNYERDGITINA
jgi:hypothetical protein